MRPHARSILPWALLFGTLCVPVACICHGGAAFLPGVPRCDFEYYFHPQRVFLARWLQAGVFPYWNPHLFCGYPVVEIQQSALFYPLNTLSLLFFSPAAGLLGILAAHVLLAGVLAWFSFRYCFGCTSLGSAAGAVIYTCGAVFAHRFMAGHLTVVFALGWLPLAAGAAARAGACVRRGARWTRWMLLAAAATACTILAGAPQYAYYTVAVQAFLLAFGWRRTLAHRAATLAGTWGFALLLSAPQWLPAMFYLPLSQRTAVEYSKRVSPALRRVLLLEYLLPAPLGDGITSLHMHKQGVWDTAGYCGTAALLLSCMALLAWRRRSRAAWSTGHGVAICVLGIYLAAGGWLPGFHVFRTPAKALCLVNLGTALLAAVGLGHFARWRAAMPFAWRGACLVAALGAAACLAVCAAAMARPAWFAPIVLELGDLTRGVRHQSVMELSAELARTPQLAARPVLRAAAWSAGVSVLVLLFMWLRGRRPGVALALMACVAAWDPALAHWRAFVSDTRADDSGWAPGFRRHLEQLIAPQLDGRELPFRFTMPDAMSNASQLVDGMLEASGYDPLMPRLALSRAVSDTQGMSMAEAKAARLAAAGTRHAIVEPPPPQPEDTSQQSRVYRTEQISTAAVTAEIVPCVHVNDGDVEFGPLGGRRHFVRAADAGRLPRELVASAAGGATAPCAAAAGALRNVPVRTPNSMVFDLETSGPAMLVVHVTWTPGWSCAAADGGRAPVAQVNGWMIGVPVDAGTRRVRLDYRPAGMRGAVFLSLIGCVGSVLVLLAVGRTRRGARPE